MKEQTKEEIEAWIDELYIKDELRQVIKHFSKTINEVTKSDCKLKFDIIIDERSSADIYDHTGQPCITAASYQEAQGIQARNHSARTDPPGGD